MKTLIPYSIVLVSGLMSGFPAFGSPEAQMAAEQEPVVSEIGRRRIQENLKLLDNSIADIKQNLESTRHNLRTIQTELDELSQLEKEHLNLRKKYSTYLSFAKAELSKNESVARDLAKWETQQRAASDKLKDKQVQDRLGAAKRELAERSSWKVDAQGKSERVKGLVEELDSNLKEIRSRQIPLEHQRTSWSKRLEEYQVLLDKTVLKRKELDALAKR